MPPHVPLCAPQPSPRCVLSQVKQHVLAEEVWELQEEAEVADAQPIAAASRGQKRQRLQEKASSVAQEQWRVRVPRSVWPDYECSNDEGWEACVSQPARDAKYAAVDFVQGSWKRVWMDAAVRVRVTLQSTLFRALGSAFGWTRRLCTRGRGCNCVSFVLNYLRRAQRDE
eukprot:7082212-Prymnesium_polylepis.2